MFTKRAKDDLDEKLLDIIVEKLNSKDMKLPPEDQMTQYLGISRTALREKLRGFEAHGFIQTRQGSGRFVKMPSLSAQISSTWAVVLRADPVKLLELLDVRILLEINTLPNAVERITNVQLQQLARFVARMNFLAKRGEPFVDEDRGFHVTLFSCTGNKFLEQLLTAFWDLYEMSITDFHHEDLALVAESHERIMAAVAHRDAETAKDLLMQQFLDSRYRITMDLAKRDMEKSIGEELKLATE